MQTMHIERLFGHKNLRRLSDTACNRRALAYRCTTEIRGVDFFRLIFFGLNKVNVIRIFLLTLVFYVLQ